VGRHRAARDAEVHPLVAAALARRAASGSAGAPRATDPAQEPGEGGIGWPAPAKPGGGGLGWPGDLDRVPEGAAAQETGPQETGPQETGPQETAAQEDDASQEAAAARGAAAATERRGVWRRLFGARPAA
jgi:hypothetical protein